MIAEWMMYCLLTALGLSIAAVLAERALLAGRAPVRLVWACAVVLSLCVPAAAFRLASNPVTQVAGVVEHHDTLVNAFADSALATPVRVAEAASVAAPSRNWRATLAQLDRPLAIIWGILSLVVALNFLAGVVTLAWMRRKWEQRTLLDVPVFISERTGPAVVGAVSPDIVLPQWVLRLAPEQLALMLRHEHEHQRARDGQLLTLARLALVVMPWNVAIWWQILRLRVAVELDCDARVLQSADARLYGDLLLEVASARREPALIGAIAFAERATQLERRIRVLSRHRMHTSRTSRSIAAVIGTAVVTVAWVAPHPAVPARPSATPLVALQPIPLVQAASILPLSLDAIKQAASAVQKPITGRDVKPQPIAKQPREFAVATKPDTTPDVAKPAPMPVVQATLADSAYKVLFDGIALSPNQETEARRILVDLHAKQLMQAATSQAYQANRTLIMARRDTALRSMLATDADRATFDSHNFQRLLVQGRGVVEQISFAAGASGAGASGGGGRGGRGGSAGAGGAAGGVIEVAGSGARGGGAGGAISSGSGSLIVVDGRVVSGAIVSRRDTTRMGDPILVVDGRIVSGGAGTAAGGGARGGGGGVAALALRDTSRMVQGVAVAGGGARGGGGGRGGPSLSTPEGIRASNDATYNRMFNGIQLTGDQEAAARLVIATAQLQMSALQQPGTVPLRMLASSAGPASRVAIQAPADAQLLALVSNDADRAIVDARMLHVP